MELHFKRVFSSGALLLGLTMFYNPLLFAAKPIDLSAESPTILVTTFSKHNFSYQEIRRNVDFKNTTHVRLQQKYSGYPVWSGEGIVHVPNAKPGQSLEQLIKAANAMNGIFYQNIQEDLVHTPASALTNASGEFAVQKAINTYKKKVGTQAQIQNGSYTRIIYIDDNNKAHWAFKVSFDSPAVAANGLPAKPRFVIDAINFNVYEAWDEIKTDQHTNEYGGGFGGNIKMGKLVYDGLKENLAKLNIHRDDVANLCFLENSEIKVEDYTTGKVMQFDCKETNPEHNDVYWSGNFDAVNDGYSPANDALFAGQVIKGMYKDWYKLEVLTNHDGTPMTLVMRVHWLQADNAYWDGKSMTFGDGYSYFYPLTSLGVGAHEVSHGFTEQHSDLYYGGQSGGMNESFSDMAAQAAEFYAYGKNIWQIGPEIFKEKDAALRYMDKPSKDCNGRKPGSNCSIDDASQYSVWLDVHYSSGVYNRLFYLIGTSEGWDTKKAFDIFVTANANYWTSHVTFKTAACGVLKATKDLNYDLDTVKKALKVVKVDYSKCK